MSSRTAFVDEALAAYVEAHSSGPDDVQRDLIAATAELGDAFIDAGVLIAVDRGERAAQAFLSASVEAGAALLGYLSAGCGALYGGGSGSLMARLLNGVS